MNGILLWAHSYCRSTLAFYEGLAKAFGVPLKVLFWRRDTSIRTSVGHSDDEFFHLDTQFIEDDVALAKRALAAHKDWHHLFGTYQKGSVYREMLLEARKAGCSVAIGSEAPCNMLGPPRSILKDLYILTALRYVVSRQVQASDFILNLSGDDDKNLRRVGWPAQKIVRCGYYSPPLVGSSFEMRSGAHWREFTVLMTGCHDWHRNPMLALHALKILKQRGVACRAVVTQEGPLLASLKAFSAASQLDVEFTGFVPYERLLELYQTCSCFLATGRAEPWGIRVNDALHCGSPLLVSEGMGAVKLVKDHGCGLSFPNKSPVALADRLQSLIQDESHYLQIAERVRVAAEACMPQAKAYLIASAIETRFPMWR